MRGHVRRAPAARQRHQDDRPHDAHPRQRAGQQSPAPAAALIPRSCPASDRHTSAGGRRFILRSLPLPDRSRRHVHSDRARPACSWRTQLRLSHTGVHHAPACSWPISAGARRHTHPAAHPGRGSTAHNSRSPSTPGLDGAPIQEHIQAGARRHKTPGAHPARGSAAHNSKSPSRPGLDGTKLQEPIPAEARRQKSARTLPKLCKILYKNLPKIGDFSGPFFWRGPNSLKRVP